MRNRQVSIQKRIIFSVFAGIACLFFFACGIPVYYVIEPPQIEHVATYETTDYHERHFSFTCPYSASSENSEFTLLGTDIYYRIYNNLDDMNSDISSISSRNSEYSDSGYLKMVELNYQQLWLTSGESPVVKKTSSTRTIELRLCTDTGYSPRLYDLTNNNLISYPLRRGTGSSGSGNMTFDFDSENNHPVSGDQDTKIREGYDNEGAWYVNLYAVTVGRDSSLAYQYSSLLHLGSLKIEEH